MRGSCGVHCDDDAHQRSDPPFSEFEKRLTQLDVRLTKALRLGSLQVKGMFDVYNVLNANAVLTQVTTYSSTNTYLRPTSVLAARLVKFGAQLDF